MPKDQPHLVWRKSSYTGGNGNCVEVADLGDAIAVRDSKNPGGPHLTLTRPTWAAFVRGLRKSNLPVEPFHRA